MKNCISKTEDERITKIYKKGKKMFYINSIVLITIGSIIILYLGLQLMEINLMDLSRNDILNLSLLILGQIFVIKNILIPVLGSWKGIESKYQEVIANQQNVEDTSNYIE